MVASAFVSKWRHLSQNGDTCLKTETLVSKRRQCLKTETVSQNGDSLSQNGDSLSQNGDTCLKLADIIVATFSEMIISTQS